MNLEDGQALARVIRRWHPTICYDLCLPYLVPVRIRYDCPQNNCGAISFGRYDQRDGTITLYAVPGTPEEQYLFILAHEAKHAWQAHYGVAPTEEQCDEYAASFVRRRAAHGPLIDPVTGYIDGEPYSCPCGKLILSGSRCEACASKSARSGSNHITEVVQDAGRPALRPYRFSEFVGQSVLIEKLKVATEAAVIRREPVPHILLYGPPGLGKTSLAHVLANEIGTKAHVTAAPYMNAMDAGKIFGRCDPGDVVFINEIHRLPSALEQIIYSIMEDFRHDYLKDCVPHSLQLSPFTLIGATTKAGSVSGPMRDRFGIVERMEYYTGRELATILSCSARQLGIEWETGALADLAERSRGTPRLANQLLLCARDYAVMRGNGRITRTLLKEALDLEGIDELGLDRTGRLYLETLIHNYGGGPASLKALAVTIDEDVDTLAGAVEPYLMHIGFVTVVSRGRRVTKAAYRHLGIAPPGVAASDGGSQGTFWS